MPITSEKDEMNYQVFTLKFLQIKQARQKQQKIFFEKIIKQVPATPKKEINMQCNEKNNSYNIEEEWIQMKKITSTFILISSKQS